MQGKPGDRFRGLSEIGEAVDSGRDLSPTLCIKFNKPAASIDNTLIRNAMGC